MQFSSRVERSPRRGTRTLCILEGVTHGRLPVVLFSQDPSLGLHREGNIPAMSWALASCLRLSFLTPPPWNSTGRSPHLSAHPWGHSLQSSPWHRNEHALTQRWLQQVLSLRHKRRRDGETRWGHGAAVRRRAQPYWWHQGPRGGGRDSQASCRVAGDRGLPGPVPCAYCGTAPHLLRSPPARGSDWFGLSSHDIRNQEYPIIK